MVETSLTRKDEFDKEDGSHRGFVRRVETSFQSRSIDLLTWYYNGFYK